MYSLQDPWTIVSGVTLIVAWAFFYLRLVSN